MTTRHPVTLGAAAVLAWQLVPLAADAGRPALAACLSRNPGGTYERQIS